MRQRYQAHSTQVMHWFRGITGPDPYLEWRDRGYTMWFWLDNVKMPSDVRIVAIDGRSVPVSGSLPRNWVFV